MAGYLAAQFPGDYYSGDEAKSLDFIGYFDNQRQKEAARQNQEINRQMALEDLYTQQAERPLKEQRLSLENQGLEALLPQKQAQGKMAKRELEVEESIPIDQRKQAALSDLARKMSDDDLKKTNNAIEMGLVHKDPAVRAQALQLRNLMSDMVKLRAGLDNKEVLADKRAAMEREKQGAIGARAAATIAARGAGKASLDDMQSVINKKRTATEKMAQIRAFLGALPADDPRRMSLMRQEAELLPMVNMENSVRTAGKQELDMAAGGLRKPQGITLEPRSGAAKPDPLGIR